MTDVTYSLVIALEDVKKAFPGTDQRGLVMGLLARAAPKPNWDDCVVYQGQSPSGPGTMCVGMTGPAADEVQQLLVESFEQLGIRVLQVYEGGPELDTPFARAEAGRWVAAG